MVVKETINTNDLYYQLNDHLYQKLKKEGSCNKEDLKEFLQINGAAITELCKKLKRYQLNNVLDGEDINHEIMTLVISAFKEAVEDPAMDHFPKYFWPQLKWLVEDELTRNSFTSGLSISRRSVLRKVKSDEKLIVASSIDEISVKDAGATNDIDALLARVDIETVRDNLPEREWFVMDAFYLQGLSHAEIAKELGISVNLSRNILSTALKHGREILQVTI